MNNCTEVDWKMWVSGILLWSSGKSVKIQGLLTVRSFLWVLINLLPVFWYWTGNITWIVALIGQCIACEGSVYNCLVFGWLGMNHGIIVGLIFTVYFHYFLSLYSKILRCFSRLILRGHGSHNVKNCLIVCFVTLRKVWH